MLLAGVVVRNFQNKHTAFAEKHLSGDERQQFGATAESRAEQKQF